MSETKQTIDQLSEQSGLLYQRIEQLRMELDAQHRWALIKVIRATVKDLESLALTLEDALREPSIVVASPAPAPIKHLAIEAMNFCRLVRGPKHVAKSGKQTVDREYVTCPDCLVCLDQFESLGLKPKRGRWTWVAEVVRKTKTSHANIGDLQFCTRSYKLSNFYSEKRLSPFPWSRGSVAALARLHRLRLGDAQVEVQPQEPAVAPVWTETSSW